MPKQVPNVMRCDVETCAYNKQRNCHAFAITIGDGERPRCDTFTKDFESGGLFEAKAKVGACKVAVCEHNKNLECQAKGIHIGRAEDEADCLTFERQAAEV